MAKDGGESGSSKGRVVDQFTGGIPNRAHVNEHHKASKKPARGRMKKPGMQKKGEC